MDFPYFGKLFLALLLGGLIGLEREIKRKEAGLRTYSLVALSSCFLTIVAFKLFNFFQTKEGISFDPSRIIQAVIVGISFIGAGVIFRQPSGILGLTTAAGLLITAAIGIAVGINQYYLAILGTFLGLIILSLFSLVEEKILKTKE